MQRPDIKNIQHGSELKRWYWLKQELVDYCKIAKLNYNGSKFDILETIANTLDEKDVATPKLKAAKAVMSKTIWAKQLLHLDTIITPQYTNGSNSRNFFIAHCGSKFHFTIPFMHFLKNNCGKTLQDAVNEWKRLEGIQQDKNYKSTIPEGNQYNKYIRDFFTDNPKMTIVQARHFWKLKKSLPLGRHRYERSDLELK